MLSQLYVLVSVVVLLAAASPVPVMRSVAQRNVGPLDIIQAYSKRTILDGRAVNNIPEEAATTAPDGVIKVLSGRAVNNIPEEAATTAPDGVIKVLAGRAVNNIPEEAATTAPDGVIKVLAGRAVYGRELL